MRAILIGTLLVGVFSGATINNIASAPLSLIAADFSSSPARITLVASASGFALACCMPVAGWLGVRWGSRQVLVGAFCLLGIGCLTAALSPTVWVLVTGRLVQGLAMSVVPPTVMYALPELLGTAKRARALGWWAVANGAGTAAGAPLGALIADTWGWRVMFFAFVPVCALLALACLWLKPDAEVQRPLDRRSALLLTITLALLMVPPMTAGLTLDGRLVATLVALGVFAFLALVWSLRRAATPFVSPTILRSAQFLIGSIGGAAQMFVLGSVAVLVPLLIVQKFGYSVRLAGLSVLAVTLTMMLLAPAVSGLVPRFRAQTMILCGLGLALVSIAVAATSFSAGSLALALSCLLALGVALSLLQSPSAIIVNAQPGSRGSGVGLYNSIRFSGGVVGVGWLSMAAQVGSTTTQAFFLTIVPIAAGAIAVGLLGRPVNG